MTREGNTPDRLQKELAEAGAAVTRILDAAPRATSKYKDVGRAGRAVCHALESALRDYSNAEAAVLRWKREHPHGGR